jgi:hypothetical protein
MFVSLVTKALGSSGKSRIIECTLDVILMIFSCLTKTLEIEKGPNGGDPCQGFMCHPAPSSTASSIGKPVITHVWMNHN